MASTPDSRIDKYFVAVAWRCLKASSERPKPDEQSRCPCGLASLCPHLSYTSLPKSRSASASGTRCARRATRPRNGDLTVHVQRHTFGSDTCWGGHEWSIRSKLNPAPTTGLWKRSSPICLRFFRTLIPASRPLHHGRSEKRPQTQSRSRLRTWIPRTVCGYLASSKKCQGPTSGAQFASTPLSGGKGSTS